MVTRAEQFAQQQDMLKNAGVDINKYNAAIAGGASVQDALKAGGYTGGSSTKTTPSTTSTTSTQSTTPTSTGTKTSSYQNQGAGNYVYNPSTGYYEKQETTTPSTTGGTDYNKSIRDTWDNKTYEEQQDFLKNNPNAKQTIINAGGTIKTSPYQNQGEGQYKYNPATGYYEKVSSTQGGGTQGGTQGKWDYQDSSEARMYEIANNLNNYRVTNPNLFNDWDTFSNFFIAGKNRSQEQLNYLRDYFNAVKRYNSLDNMTADAVGSMLARGEVSDDYLNYLKYADPQRYAEVMDAKARETNKIKDSASMDTINSMEGGKDITTSKAIEWLKAQGLLVDKDGNLIDDRTENYATEEEKQYAKNAADLIARNLDIDNTVKHTYEDYVKAYPGATKATLMAMAQDTNADLLREKENNNVELTRLQGYMNYLQTEREDRNEIGQNAIEQLQKQYGMYYQYSPEGMSELLNAQYEATSPSLTSVENGTETEKRRALDTVLTDYYDKYSSIIQRPKSQVISDVIAYANNKGITLEQALQENFVTPLKAKSEYKSLSSNLEGSKYKFASYEGADGVKHTVRYNEETGDWEEIFGEGAEGYNYGLIGGVSDFISNLTAGGYKIAPNGGSGGDKIRGGGCGTVVNDYLEALGEGIRLTEANDIKTYATSKTPSEGAIAYFNGTQSRATPATEKHGHVAIVVGDNGDTITVLESNEGTGLRYNNYKKSDVTGYYKPRKNELGYGENPMTDIISLIRNKGNLTSDGKKDIDLASKAYQIMYELASDGDIDYLIKSPEGQKFLSNLKKASFTVNGSDDVSPQEVFNALKNNITDQRNLKTVNKLVNVIELKLRRTSGAAISASEWNSNFDMLLPGVNENPDVSLDKYRTFEKAYLLDYFNSAGNNIKGYKYIPLFEEGSPYYKVVSTTDNKDKKTTGGGVEINEVNWTPYTGGISVGFSTGDLINLWNEN